MKIVTAVVNNTDFIEIQYYTLKKYVKGEYEFIVFNDAKDFPDSTNYGDITIKNKIELLCTKLNIKCINIPNQHHRSFHSPSGRCGDSTNYILKYQTQNPDKYLVLDSDMFLIDDFDINKYSSYECAIVLQQHSSTMNYLWPGLCYFDMSRMKNIDLLNYYGWQGCQGSDVGGGTTYWLSEQMHNCEIPKCEEIRWSNKTFHTENTYFIKHFWSGTWDITDIPEKLKDNKRLIDFLTNDIRNRNIKFQCELYDGVFLHYLSGCGWKGEGLEFHKKLTQQLKEALI